jgi:hypothetical protein
MPVRVELFRWVYVIWCASSMLVVKRWKHISNSKRYVLLYSPYEVVN